LPRVDRGWRQLRMLLMSRLAVGESTTSLTGYIFCILSP
jgi:hypothetical protein